MERREDMAYRTINELAHFEFQEAEILEMRMERGHLNLDLDSVTILPENSCNRDIRKMGAKELRLQFQFANITLFVEEGYKLFDADGNPKDVVDDRIVTGDEIGEIMQQLTGGHVYAISCREMEENSSEVKRPDEVQEEAPTEEVGDNEPDKGQENVRKEYELLLDGEERTYQVIVSASRDVEEWERFMNRCAGEQ